MSRPRQAHDPIERRRARKRAGYTMIEVMMALAVLTIGAVGVMALQAASTRGNMEAREMSTATLLAQRWVERLRHDSLYWTRNSTTVDSSLLLTTQYLSAVPNPGSTTSWFIPTTDPAFPDRVNFDYFGNDTDDATAMHFCTNVRLEWIYVGRAMRADVRVWWLRRQTGGSTDASRATLAGCAPSITNPSSLTGDRRLRFVYASTILRWNPLPTP